MKRFTGRHTGLVLVATLMLFALGGLACAPAADSGTTPTAPAAGTDTGSSMDVDPPADSNIEKTGAVLFGEKGCASCHGEGGVGSEIAPALTGHSSTQVHRQVRAPVGTMPPFSPDMISNDELAKIAEFVTSLGGSHGHQSAADTGSAILQHHWMALFALEDGNAIEADHHLTHIVEITEGAHRQQMEAALAQLRAGDLHDAEHTVQGMLAGVAAEDLGVEQMHLRMALSSLRVEEPDGAVHHMQHAIEAAMDRCPTPEREVTLPVPRSRS